MVRRHCFWKPATVCKPAPVGSPAPESFVKELSGATGKRRSDPRLPALVFATAISGLDEFTLEKRGAMGSFLYVLPEQHLPQLRLVFGRIHWLYCSPPQLDSK
jgi:hypothetical protein